MVVMSHSVDSHRPHAKMPNAFEFTCAAVKKSSSGEITRVCLMTCGGERRHDGVNITRVSTNCNNCAWMCVRGDRVRHYALWWNCPEKEGGPVCTFARTHPSAVVKTSGCNPPSVVMPLFPFLACRSNE